jgi:hypothetical protein
MTAEEEPQPRYRVVATKAAKRAGNKLFAEEKNRLWLIRELQKLKFWPANRDEFEHEKLLGAIKLDFHVEQKWIRVFIYEDKARETVWVIGAFAKKTNRLTTAQMISVETAVSRVEQEIRLHEKKQKQLEQTSKLRVIEGGKK